MKALVWEAPRIMGLREQPEPSVEPGPEALARDPALAAVGQGFDRLINAPRSMAKVLLVRREV